MTGFPLPSKETLEKEREQKMSNNEQPPRQSNGNRADSPANHPAPAPPTVSMPQTTLPPSDSVWRESRAIPEQIPPRDLPETSQSGPQAAVRTFVRDHPWLILGSAIGVGIGLGYGSRHIPEDAVSRAVHTGRQAAPGIGAVLGTALLRAGITAALRRFGDRS